MIRKDKISFPNRFNYWQEESGRNIMLEKRETVLYGRTDTMRPLLKPVSIYCGVVKSAILTLKTPSFGEIVNYFEAVSMVRLWCWCTLFSLMHPKSINKLVMIPFPEFLSLSLNALLKFLQLLQLHLQLAESYKLRK